MLYMHMKVGHVCCILAYNFLLDGSDAQEEGVWSFANSDEPVYLNGQVLDIVGRDCLVKAGSVGFDHVLCDEVNEESTVLCEIEQPVG